MSQDASWPRGLAPFAGHHYRLDSQVVQRRRTRKLEEEVCLLPPPLAVEPWPPPITTCNLATSRAEKYAVAKSEKYGVAKNNHSCLSQLNWNQAGRIKSKIKYTAPKRMADMQNIFHWFWHPWCFIDRKLAQNNLSQNFHIFLIWSCNQQFFYRTQVLLLATLVTHWLTDSLTRCCLEDIQLLKKHTLNPEITLIFINFMLKKPCLQIPKSAT